MRRFLPAAMMVCLLASGELAAHAIVTATSLKEHPVMPGQPTEVLLSFNGRLEIALSRVFLVSQGDNYQQLALKSGRAQGELLVEVPALAAGDYALKYRILAVDGHMTEDVIRFHVGP